MTFEYAILLTISLLLLCVPGLSKSLGMRMSQGAVAWGSLRELLNIRVLIDILRFSVGVSLLIKLEPWSSPLLSKPQGLLVFFGIGAVGAISQSIRVKGGRVTPLGPVSYTIASMLALDVTAGSFSSIAGCAIAFSIRDARFVLPSSIAIFALSVYLLGALSGSFVAVFCWACLPFLVGLIVNRPIVLPLDRDY